MAQDKNLVADNQRRIEQYENIKDTARNEIQAQVEDQAERLTPVEQAQAAELGDEFKREAVSEVRSTDTEIKRASAAARTSQVIDYIFYLIYGLIGLRIIFDLLGAQRSNTFRNFIDALTTPLLAPFRSLFPDVGAGRFQLRFSYIAALVVYLLLHLAINGLLRLIAHRKTAI
jgi:uncharacterized protein YggT (Ycf19 family)